MPRPKVTAVYEPNWRVLKHNASILTEKVEKKLKEVRVDSFIFAILDNSIYHALADNATSYRRRARASTASTTCMATFCLF
jgi:hypothetical protein